MSQQTDDLTRKTEQLRVSDAAPKGRYVPPHLRGRESAPAPAAAPAPAPSSNDNRSAPARFTDVRSGDRDNRDSRGGERDQRSGADLRDNGRWSGFSNDRFNSRPDDRVDPWANAEPADPDEDAAHLFEVEGSGINFEKYDDIPVEVSGENCPHPINGFDDNCGLSATLLENVKRAKYKQPTPVQKHAIPIGLAKRDLMACAQTGSGKTVAFLFPILEQMIRTGSGSAGAYIRTDYGRTPKAAPTALVLAPTRELAVQIYDEARKFSYRSRIRPVVVYGGAEIRNQIRDLDRGCDLIVATPGRLVDLIERARITLSGIRFLVLDEADRMLDMGFEPQIRRIVEGEDMPVNGRQTLMFSATFPREIQQLAGAFLDHYIFLAVGRVGSSTDLITQKLVYCEEQEKKDALIDLLSASAPGLTLVFVETKRSADLLEDYLIYQNFQATSIHGDRSQRDREDALSAFRSGRCPILVATDVAARGLDIPNVTHVINYDLPNYIDDYVHRIGRTGRAGKTGVATAFVNEKNRTIFRDLLETLQENNQEIPDWFQRMIHTSDRRGGRGGGGGGGGKFGGRDFRSKGDHGRRRGDGGSGGRGGGSSGGGGSRASGGAGGDGWGGSAGGGGGWGGNSGAPLAQNFVSGGNYNSGGSYR